MSWLSSFTQTPPDTLALLALAAFVAGTVRGFSGFGAGMIFMPAAAALVGPHAAVGMFALTDSLLTLPMVRNALRHWRPATVVPLTITAVMTIPLGAYVLLVVDAITVRWLLAVIILCLLGLLISGWRYHGQPKAIVSLGLGAVTGTLSGVSQVSGPPVVAYWLAGPDGPRIVRANLIVFFAITGLVGVLTYFLTGFLDGRALALFCVMGPVYAAALWLGARGFGSTLFGRFSERTYRGLAYALILFAVITSLPALDPWLRPPSALP